MADFACAIPGRELDGLELALALCTHTEAEFKRLPRARTTHGSKVTIGELQALT